MFRKFRTWFWQPPRAHGQAIEERTVSFLELFYDLVYVVVIAQAAHHLATHVSWRGIGEFAVIFGLIWIAWLNGTVWYDLHGQPDGRSRLFVFLQMMLLALLAVYTAGAAGEDGRAFAIVYSTFMGLLTWLWFSVRRVDDELFSTVTFRYLVGIGAVTVIMLISGFLPDGARMLIWAIVVIAATTGFLALIWSEDQVVRAGFGMTESAVERFGLLTIIVLGEVVVGVVEGLSEAHRSLETYVTAGLGLIVGFSIWWTYFDFVSRRLPVQSGPAIARWMLSHLPVTGAIAATGAAMVGIVEHASDDHAPAVTAWLLSGSVALALIAMIVTMTTLQDFKRFPSVFRPATATMVLAAIISLLVGWWQPVPWLQVLILVLLLSFVWFLAVASWLRLDNPDEAIA